MTTTEHGLGDECAICQVSESEHKIQERLGQKQHRWTRNPGELQRVDRTPPRQAQQQPVILVPGVDFPLRELLRQKGVLTDEDIAALGATGPITSRDRETGSTKSTN